MVAKKKKLKGVRGSVFVVVEERKTQLYEGDFLTKEPAQVFIKQLKKKYPKRKYKVLRAVV